MKETLIESGKEMEIGPTSVKHTTDLIFALYENEEYEMARAWRNDLFVAILEAITNNRCENPIGCAHLALETLKCDLERKQE